MNDTIKKIKPTFSENPRFFFAHFHNFIQYDFETIIPLLKIIKKVPKMESVWT